MNGGVTCLCFCLLLLEVSVESANILAIFPTASYSHQMPLLAVARSLAERGHNLTVITPNPLKEHIPNYTDIDISFSYDYWKPRGDQKALVNLQKRMSPLEAVDQLIPAMIALTEIQLNSTPIQNFIQYLDLEKPKFDLVLYEDLSHTAYLGILPKIGFPPLVSFLTLSLPCTPDFQYGTVCNPSYTSDLIMGFTNRMTFFERLKNYAFIFYQQYYIQPYIHDAQIRMARKYFGLTSHSPAELARNKSLFLLTTSWLYQYPRPVFPNTIMLGPTHIGDTKPLPQDLQSWIEGAENGVIYFSLGSNMKSTSLEENKRTAILGAFARFPEFRIIWKWEEEALSGLPENVICRKWLPQHDLLAHSKIKLFITQGGLQSMHEGLYFEVPMIGIPFFGDQDYNVNFLRRLGIGDFIDFADVNTESLYEKMKEILHNKSYMENVRKYSAISKTQMLSPRDSAVWWVEYVLKTGGNTKFIQPADYLDIPWYQYLGLDVFLVFLSPVIFILYVLYRLVSVIRRKLTTQKLKQS